MTLRTLALALVLVVAVAADARACAAMDVDKALAGGGAAFEGFVSQRACSVTRESWLAYRFWETPLR